ncbi:DUF3467 domain-containing protein [Porphyromonas macacae]|uniref:Protein of uncharacterized function (DUF3467) n=1 Tax=Porphyromonas macacae TaxID=28115 RepID=A0A379DG52_9PORP|nr:DUF3467 domain-containing protein [Porphyromonas macacae]SUB77122.1 Protein of uncharacterised function (DUF3467) [Porphyromonas macacae]
MEEDKENKDSVSINLDDSLVEGVYSNLAIVMHSQSEFILDFIRLLPHQQQSRVKSRIVMSPDNVKRLAHLLLKNIEDYEQNFGEIHLPEMSTNKGDGAEFQFSKHLKGEA